MNFRVVYYPLCAVERVEDLPGGGGGAAGGSAPVRQRSTSSTARGTGRGKRGRAQQQQAQREAAAATLLNEKKGANQGKTQYRIFLINALRRCNLSPKTYVLETKCKQI